MKWISDETWESGIENHERGESVKKNIEVWSDYDRQGQWVLNIRKTRGTLTLEEIREACMEYEQDFYMLVICAMDRDIAQYYETDDLESDYVQLYRADDFFKWRERSI